MGIYILGAQGGKGPRSYFPFSIYYRMVVPNNWLQLFLHAYPR